MMYRLRLAEIVVKNPVVFNLMYQRVNRVPLHSVSSLQRFAVCMGRSAYA
jgi:hypothetical protein